MIVTRRFSGAIGPLVYEFTVAPNGFQAAREHAMGFHEVMPNRFSSSPAKEVGLIPCLPARIPATSAN
jgi:hypothetical protein